MPSTFTTSLGLEKQATGENANTWGNLLNSTLDLVDKAVANRLTKSVAGGLDVTLTASEALNAIHEYTGTLTANINVNVPTQAKIYFVFNNTTGNFSLTVKTVAGTGIAVRQGMRMILYCDGTNVVRARGFPNEAFLENIRKTSDQTVNNSTTLVNDTDLLTSLAPNERVSFMLIGFFSSSAVADFKYSFNAPSGSTITYSPPNGITTNSSGTIVRNNAIISTGIFEAVNGGGTGTAVAFTLAGWVENGSTAGNLQLRWAQNTLEATDTKVLAGSRLVVMRE